MTGALAGKVGIITGAASGIGRATAVRFAREGAQLALFDLDIEGLKATSSQLDGDDHRVLELDVTKQDLVQQSCDLVASEKGRIDFLVNAAGVELPGTIFSTGPDTWRRTMDINVSGSFYTSQAVCKKMKEQSPQGGAIVNLGSTASAIAIADLLAYCVSKGAVAQLTRGIAVEGGPFNIRANCVHPGYTNTPMGNAGAAHQGVAISDFQERAAKKYPMGRIAEPEEVVAAILFLCTPEASFITGAQLSVDGGLVAKQPLA